ncbi:DUF6776 family protein [uncultured Luteimonas sp.]|uniref:DUF6776 family protein n=1 Tax=uncultured Luteimonas sp. TaxID=453144 RepID=UPI002636213F|nr:DUF6776 family protein [uncultured Luteimonas sp.]
MSDSPSTAPKAEASAGATVPAHVQGASYAVLAVFVAALAFGVWGVWQVVVGPAADAGGDQAQVEALAQQVATLSRSDQISREANRDLQGTLAERDEEISALRADVAFYERFVGSTAQRRGLTVHELALSPRSGQAWHYTATLTQNLNRGAVSSGRLSLALEGTRDGRLEQLDWAALRQDPDAAGVEYSFKYFQQVEGEIMLPPDFAPLRIRVRLAPASGPAVEQTLPWDEVAGAAAG